MSKIWAGKYHMRALNNTWQQNYSPISEFSGVGGQIYLLFLYFHHFMYEIYSPIILLLKYLNKSTNVILMTTLDTANAFVPDYENQKKLSNHFAISWINNSISILSSGSIFLDLYMILLPFFFFLPVWYTNDTVFFKTIGITNAITSTFSGRNWTVYLHKVVSNAYRITFLPEIGLVFS